MDYQRHALCIPAVWLVCKNHFYDITPDQALNNNQLGFPFQEDILYLKNNDLGLAIDLGWYPEGDPNGHYKLYVIKFAPEPRHASMPAKFLKKKYGDYVYMYERQYLQDDDAWRNPILSFQSKNQCEIVDKINQALLDMSVRESFLSKKTIS